jgi:hypothetical protein
VDIAINAVPSSFGANGIFRCPVCAAPVKLRVITSVSDNKVVTAIVLDHPPKTISLPGCHTGQLMKNMTENGKYVIESQEKLGKEEIEQYVKDIVVEALNSI